MDILFFVVAFLSSIVGAICGIGGGVVIKPVLDMLQMGAPATINFLSGCTVLSMSCLLYTSPSPRDRSVSRMPSSA